MPNPYERVSERAVQTHRRIHANSEQTYVSIFSVGDGFACVAYDLDPRDYEPIDALVIGYDPTIDGAEQRARRWMETNPRGVAGSSGGGRVGLIRRLIKKVNDYGNTMVEQQQQQQQTEDKLQ